MEQLNKVELIGVVGTIRVQTISDVRLAKMQVATSYVYRDTDGTPVIETNWHAVKAWEGRNIDCLYRIAKGTKIHVLGRIRYQRYTDANGEEKNVTEIIASKVEVLDGDRLDFERGEKL